jgi:phosphopantetheinyl transferase
MWDAADPAGAGGGVALSLHLLGRRRLAAVPEATPPLLPDPDIRMLKERFESAGRRRLAEAARVLAYAALEAECGCVRRGHTLAADAFGRPRVLGAGCLDVGISHDSTLIVVLTGGGCCGVDVEDAPEQELSDVAHRFCGPADAPLCRGPGWARRLWTAKESAAKALGPGLRAGLATINFRSCPGQGWSSVVWRGRPTALVTRTVDCGGRHLAVTAARPTRLRAQLWEPVLADGLWRLRRAGAPAPARPPAGRASVSRTQPWGT